MAIGVAKLLQPEGTGRVGGAILTGIGAIFAIENFFFLRIDVWRWWPLAIVVLGVLLVMKAFRNETSASGLPGPAAPAGGGVPPQSQTFAAGVGSTRSGTTAAKISEFAIWSGIERRVSSPAFKQADLTAIMGGIELDLRQASTDNGVAVIEIFVLWGGIEITVPPDWAVANEVTPIMGGAEDKSTGTQQSRHRLIVKGVVIMGGVDIKT
jgi:hypothetical protein